MRGYEAAQILKEKGITVEDVSRRNHIPQRDERF